MCGRLFSWRLHGAGGTWGGEPEWRVGANADKWRTQFPHLLPQMEAVLFFPNLE